MAHMKSMIEKGLKDMKESKLSDEKVEATVSDVEYPYGLRMTLDKKALETLGLSAAKFKVGEETCLKCRAEVISISANKHSYGSTENVELQITHLGVEQEED